MPTASAERTYRPDRRHEIPSSMPFEWADDRELLTPEDWHASVVDVRTRGGRLEGTPRLTVRDLAAYYRLVLTNRALEHLPTLGLTQQTDISEAIHSSRRILQLRDNWDGEGSPGYTEFVWERARDLLVEMTMVARRFDKRLPVPSIGPAEGGTIDLYWRSQRFSILFNIHPDPAEPIVFSSGVPGDEPRIDGRVDSRDEFFSLLVLLIIRTHE